MNMQRKYSRFSNLERGYVQPTEDELPRLTSALEQLIQAKAAIQETATAVGWPVPEFR